MRLTRPGATLAVHDRGGAERPVVLTHGAGMDHTAFDDVATGLHEAGHRVVTWDLRGHGGSMLDAGTRFTAADALDDLTALIGELGLVRPFLVGHSLGGNLSQALVRRSPDLAGGLIAIGCTANTGALSPAERFALRHLSGPILAMIPARRLPRMLADASATTPAARERIVAVFARMPKRTFLDVWRGTASLVEPDPSYRTPVPLALIRGGDDQTGNIADAMHAWAVRDGVTERVIPGAGHVAMWDAPVATTHAVLEAVAVMDP